MKTRTIFLLAALLLVVTTAHATIDRRGVGMRLVSEPGFAVPGELFEAEFEVRTGQPVRIHGLTVEGNEWDSIRFTQPDLTSMEPGEAARFTVSGVPDALDAPLRLVLGTDLGDVEKTLTIRRWSPGRERFKGRLLPATAEMVAQLDDPGYDPSTVLFAGTPPTPAPPVDHPLYGQDPTDVDDPGVRNKSYSLRVTGRIVYVRDDGKIVGVYAPAVRLYDEDSSWDEHLGTTTTDENGYFEFNVTWDPCLVCDSTPDLYVEIESANPLVEVEESTYSTNYGWVTDVWDDYGYSSLEMGVIYINWEDSGGAADILTTLTRTNEWLRGPPHDVTVPQVYVQWPSDECSSSEACYQTYWGLGGSYGEIHLSHERTWNRAVYIHEFGHHVMEYWGSNDPPDYCNPGDHCDGDDGCGHCVWCPENGVIALQEGFPNWMADAVLRYWEANWPVPPYNSYSQEDVAWCTKDPDGTENWGDADRTEGFFGALLRDLEDATMDRHDNFGPGGGTRDRLALGSEPIMKVMLGYDNNQIFLNPTTPTQFLELFMERYPEVNGNALWSTAKNCGYELDTTPPLHPNNLDSPTHREGVPSPNAFVQFTWDLPTDDLSGLAGFSWAIGGDHPIMPDTILDISLKGEEEIGPLPPGTYHFSVRSKDYAGNWSPYYSSFGPIIIRDATPVDLVCSSNMGWEFPLVPRSDDTATQFDVHLTPTLPGDVAGTWWNFSGNNAGEQSVPGDDFTVGLYLDGEVTQEFVYPAVGGHQTYLELNVGPVSVPGGRHTLEIRHDSLGEVAEVDEANNVWARQFVWTPELLVPGAVTLVTESLPDPTAGHEWIEAGVPVFPNCRGFAFAGGTGWDAVSLVNLDPVDDFDLSLHPASTGSEDGFTNKFAHSVRDFEEVDIVFVNGNNMGAQDWNLGVTFDKGADSGDYELQHVPSVPLPYTGFRVVGLNVGEYVDLTETNFSSATGPVTVSLSADPAYLDGTIRIGRLAPQTQYTSMNTLQDVHELPLSGYLEFDLPNTQDGSNCFVVYRDPRDSQADVYLRLEITPQLPNIVPVALSGWDGPIVPTATPLAAGPAVLPSNLPGDAAGTYFNWALANQSFNATDSGTGFRSAVMLDGMTQMAPIVPDVNGGFAAWGFGSYAYTVRAGRHSLTFHTDTRDDVEEYDEEDNVTGSQFVWEPVTMPRNASVLRTTPPPMTAGWNGLAPGQFYFNCDGVRTPEFDPERDGTFVAVAMLPPAEVDYDLRIHTPGWSPTTGFGSSLMATYWGPGSSEYILVDFTETRARQFDAGVIKESGTGDYVLQNALPTPLILEQGVTRYGPFTLAENQIAALHEVDLPRGGIYVTLENSRYPADLGISFHTTGEAYQRKSDAQAAAWSAPAGEDETIYVNEYATPRQCIVVWKRDASADLPRTDYYINFGEAPSSTPDVPVAGFALHAAVPNPFNPQTKIAFDLPAAAEVRLQVYDVAGRRVRALVDGEVRGSGRHEIFWNGRDDGGRAVAAGTYFYRLETPGFAQTRSMTLVK